MTASHPSPLALERLSLGELSKAEEAGVRAHVEGCGSCSRRLQAMDTEAARFSRSPRSGPARQRFARADRTWRRNAMLAVLAPAVAVAAVLVAQPWETKPSPVVALKEPPMPAPARAGRETVDLRPGASSPRLRSVSLRGQDVALGEGALEAADATGPARPFVLERTKVVAEVSGFVSAVTVTQEFKNPFPRPVEAVYVFPLPDDAAVDEMTLTAGSRVLRATIQKRGEARRMYEEAKAQGRRAALLDQERPNLFTQSVANLLPGEKVQVMLRYVAPLRYDDGAYTFNFPMTVGPRYVPGAALPGESQGTGTSPDTTRALDASRITPPAERTGRDISVEVRLDAGAPIEALWSVSHHLVADRPDPGRAVVTLAGADRIPNKDLVLRWSVSGPQKRAAVLSTGGRGGAFALMLNPEANVPDVAVTPKELVFVIDTSGSMSGAPLLAAKRAMALAMQQMNPRDTFMLIDFADRASSFHDTPLAATDANVQRALAYLQALPSSGGTNQLEGLHRALARPEDPERLRIVLLMTDGLIGDEREIFAEAQRQLGHARLFGFGIGSSVNHYLLSRLSELGRGFYQYVRTDEDPGAAVERFVRRIAKPLMTDVTIDWGGLQVFDVLPRAVPDLFDAQPLIVMGRAKEPGTGVVTLKGRVAGQPVSFSTPVTFGAERTGGAGLMTMWARARIEDLDRQQHWGETSDAVNAITTLGLEYHLVTAYTSLVAVEDRPVTAPGASKTVTVPTEPVDGLEQTGEGDARDVTIDGRFRTKTPAPTTPRTGADNWSDRVNYRRVVTLPVTAPMPPVGGDGKLGKVSGHTADTGGARAGDDGTDDDGDAFASVFGTQSHGPGGLGGDPHPSPDEAERAANDPAPDQIVSALGVPKETEKVPPAKHDVYLPPAPGGATVKDSLGSSDIMEVVLAHKSELAACAEAQRKLDPTTSGKLTLKWTVTINGRVIQVEVVSKEFEKTRFAQCVVRVVKTWLFPRHSGPAQVVTFPFKF